MIDMNFSATCQAIRNLGPIPRTNRRTRARARPSAPSHSIYGTSVIFDHSMIAFSLPVVSKTRQRLASESFSPSLNRPQARVRKHARDLMSPPVFITSPPRNLGHLCRGYNGPRHLGSRQCQIRYLIILFVWILTLPVFAL